MGRCLWITPARELPLGPPPHCLGCRQATSLQPPGTLSVRDHMALQLAAPTFRHEAQREERAWQELGMSATRLWARVNWLIDQPEAEVAYPREVRRLKRLRGPPARRPRPVGPRQLAGPGDRRPLTDPRVDAAPPTTQHEHAGHHHGARGRNNCAPEHLPFREEGQIAVVRFHP